MREPLERRAVLLGLLGVAGGVAVAGCKAKSTGATGATSSPSASPSASATPTVAADTRPRWPLNGHLMKHKDDGKHAAVAVKVPDNQNEHPQSGLDSADIVYVELDGYRDASGYSGTRLVPIFHSKMPDDVAPVRSIRPVDIAMMSPIGVIIGNTGATRWVIRYVTHFGKYLDGLLSYINTKGSGSYSIDPSRVRTYQGVTYYDRAVVCHPKILARQTKKFSSGPKEAYLPWATGTDVVSTTKGKKAHQIHVPWKQGQSYDMGYQYDAKTGRYPRSMPWGPHVLTNGKRVAPVNILVIRAKQTYGKIYPGPGGVEPIHHIIDGKGTFYYFHGGRYVTGTWTKAAVEDPFTFTLDDGSPLKMAPGQTYIELPNLHAKLRIKA